MPRFLQKACGCGRSPQEKSEAEAKNERAERSDKKEESKRKYVKNAKHSQTDIFFCGFLTQREITNTNTKVFGFAFYKKRTGVGGAHDSKCEVWS